MQFLERVQREDSLSAFNGKDSRRGFNERIQGEDSNEKIGFKERIQGEDSMKRFKERIQGEKSMRAFNERSQ